MPLSWSVISDDRGEVTYSVSGTMRMRVGHDENQTPYGTLGLAHVMLPGVTQYFYAFCQYDYQDGKPAIIWFTQVGDRDIWRLAIDPLGGDDCPFTVQVTGTLKLLGAVVENPQPAAMIGLHQCTGNRSAALSGDLDLYIRAQIESPRLTVTVGSMSHSVDLEGPLHPGPIYVGAVIGGLYTGTIEIEDNQVLGFDPQSYFGWGVPNSAQTAFVEASYSRSQGVCGVSRSLGWHLANPTCWGSVDEMHCRAVVGNGLVKFYGAMAGESGGALYGSQQWEATHQFQDFCGGYSLPSAVRLANMGSGSEFVSAPDARRGDVRMTSIERHPVEQWEDITPSLPGESFDHQHAVYSYDGAAYIDPSQEATITYQGHWWYAGSATRLDLIEEFYDLPNDTREGANHIPNYPDLEGYYAHHGGGRISNVASSWHPTMPRPELPPYGHYDEPAIQEPSHPAWTSDGIHWPDQMADESGNPVYSEVTGEPIWDTSAECRNKQPWHDDRVDLVCLPWSRACFFELYVPGTPGYSVGSLNPYDWLGQWVLTNCTEAAESERVRWTPGAGQRLVTELPHSAIFPTGIRLSGFRFLKVPWDTGTEGAAFDLAIGGHTWRLAADYPAWAPGISYKVDDTVKRADPFGLYHCTVAHTAAATWEGDAGNWAAGAVETIDLCRPDSSTVPSAPLSVAVDPEYHETSAQSPHPVDVDWEWNIVMPEGRDLIRFFVRRFEPDLAHPLEVYDGANKLGELDPYTNRYSQWWPQPQGDVASDWFEVTSGTATVKLVHDDINQTWGVLFGAYELASSSYVRASAQQSIAPYEKPLDRSTLKPDGTNERADDEDSIFLWEYPAGWGVGRIDSVKVTSLTDGADIAMGRWTLYRKSAEEGGFAQVLVMPHEPYNDWRSFAEDACWQPAGDTLNASALGPPYWNYRRIVPKLLVVVDGAVVLEMPAGYVEEENSDRTILVGSTELSSPFYSRSRFRFAPAAWQVGYPYAVGDYVVYDHASYRCILAHSSVTENAPPDATYWVADDYAPLAYPAHDYNQPDGPYLGNYKVEATGHGCDLIWSEEFQWNYAWTTFLRDGVYDVPADEGVYIPWAFHAWRLFVRPGSLASLGLQDPGPLQIVVGWEKILRGCATGLAWNGGEPARNTTVKLSAPNDYPDEPDPDAPTTYYATTNRLGWFISPALKTRFVATVTGAGTPQAVGLPVRSRMYSRMAVDVAETGSGASVDSEPACRLYRAYARGGEIVLDHSDDGGQTWRPQPPIAVGTGESPAICAEWHATYQQLALVYVDSGSLLLCTSDDEGDTWSEPMQLCSGTHPVIYRDPATGHRLLFYIQGGKLWVRRSDDNFEHWIKADGTRVATSPEPPAVDVAFEVASDAADDVVAVECDGSPQHRIVLVYQQAGGTLASVFSQANGMPPYA